MGLISLPIMLRYGYDRRVASGVIAASARWRRSPPSLVLIVMADQLGRSVGDMYEGAFIPGLVLSAMYAGYIFLVSIFRPSYVPGLPVQDIGFKEDDGSRGVWQLGVLVAFSGLVGYYVMSQTKVSNGADFVILTMSVAVVVSFLCALMNKLFGAQRVLLSILATAVLIGAWWLLKGSGYPNWALLAEALAAGALYAVIVGVVQRVSGVKLMSRMATQVTFVMVPPLALIFLVLGTIFIGVATPTEGGAMGRRARSCSRHQTRDGERAEPAQLRHHQVGDGIDRQALGLRAVHPARRARVLAHLLRRERASVGRALLVSLPGGQTGFLIVVNVLVFLLAFFLDFFELAFIVVPLLGPAAEKLGID